MNRGDRVESIRAIGNVEYGYRGTVRQITSGGNVIVAWDSGDLFTMLPNEVVTITEEQE